jgi:hypothetical protein
MRVCLVCLLAMLTSLGATAGEDPVVAEGDWGKITQAELEYARQTSPPGTTDEALIEQMARDSLGARNAIAAGVDKEPLSRWRLWSIDQGLGGRQLYESLIASMVHVTTEELKKTYMERLPKFKTPGNFSFRYIFSDTTECKIPSEVEAVKAKIQQAHDELLAGLGTDPPRPWIVKTEEFVEVAKKYSDVKGEPGRVAGPFKFDEPLQPVIKNTVLGLKPHEMSPVFSTRYGYEIVRLEDRIQDSTVEFEKVAHTLRQELENSSRMQKGREYIEALRADKSRYDIYEDKLVQMLPGAHFEVPSTTAVVRVGKTLYAPEQLQEFLDNICRRDWVRAKEKKEAIDLVWRAFVLPQLLREEAEKAGFTKSVTEQARARHDRNAVLAGSWLAKETDRIVSGMPKPSTDEVRALYEKDKDKYRIADRFLMTSILFPMDEIKKKDITPAQIEFLFREGETLLSELLAQITQGASPEALAKTSGTEKRPLKYEKKWYAKGIGFDNDTWEALQKLMPGQWTEKPVRTDRGVNIVYVEQIEPERVKTFEEVYQTLYRQMTSERARATRTDLVKKLTDEALSTLKKP